MKYIIGLGHTFRSVYLKPNEMLVDYQWKADLSYLGVK
jgi:hypothetical protein